MSHELEFTNGVANIAWTKEKGLNGVPWHGLGVEVPPGLTPEQIGERAGVNWRVESHPVFAEVDGVRIETGHNALIRATDKNVLDIITEDWVPMQNEDALAFFNEFVAAGDMEMTTVGSLKGGRIVWAMAKVNEAFELFDGKDRIEANLLFTNPHTYGKSIDVRFTAERVVCHNTLTLAMNQQSKNLVRVNHRNEFDPDAVKETLGVAKHKLAKYKEQAQFLSSKKAASEDVVEYFNRVFPVLTKNDDSKKEASKSAKKALEILDTQPGAEFGRGSWWQTFNAVTYCTDHIIGRSADTRLQSAWYGANMGLKTKALELALEMAS